MIKDFFTLLILYYSYTLLDFIKNSIAKNE